MRGKYIYIVQRPCHFAISLQQLEICVGTCNHFFFPVLHFSVLSYPGVILMDMILL